MKSFFVIQKMNILNAVMSLGIDLALSLVHPNHFIINLTNNKMLLVPVK